MTLDRLYYSFLGRGFPEAQRREARTQSYHQIHPHLVHHAICGQGRQFEGLEVSSLKSPTLAQLVALETK